MNPKITKIIGDMEKTREKIAEQQSRLKELERMKTELENADIVSMVRSIDIPPDEFEAFARAFMEQRKTAAVPDNIPAHTGRRSRGVSEDAETFTPPEDSEPETKEGSDNAE